MEFLEYVLLGAVTFLAVGMDDVIAYHAITLKMHRGRLAITLGVVVGTLFVLTLASIAGSSLGRIPGINQISAAVLYGVALFVFFSDLNIRKKERVEERALKFEIRHHINYFLIGLCAYFLLAVDDGVTYALLFEHNGGNAGIALGAVAATVLALVFTRRLYVWLMRSKKFSLAAGTVLVFIATLKLLGVI